MSNPNGNQNRMGKDPLIFPGTPPRPSNPAFKDRHLSGRPKRRRRKTDKSLLPNEGMLNQGEPNQGGGRFGQMPEQDAEKNPNEVWAHIKKPWSMRKRVAVLSAFAFVAIFISAISGVIWVQRQLNPSGPEGVEVLVEIPDGASINDISRILTDKGVVSNFTVTRFWWRNAGPYSAGTYTFNENMSVNSAKKILDQGPIASFDLITLPEGLWLSDIEQRLLASLPDFDKLELDAALRGNLIRSRYQPAEIESLEGLLFADTYQISESGVDDEFGLVQRMVNQFDSVLDELGYSQAPALLGYSPYEVIIVASIVEEEARVPEDRAKIARVMYNRIANNMRLDVDATVLYAIGEHKSELTASDLRIDSPYNTRLNRGLPPTPISSPGRLALEAALYPAEGDWLFYVLADADGRHFFTPDFTDFQNQVRRSREQGLFE